jgi:hypothetical protein
MAELFHATGELVYSLCCSITACKELNRVINLLELASNTLLDFQSEQLNYDILDDIDSIKNNILRLAEIKDVSAPAIRQAFFSSSFQELAEVLLSGNY